MLFLEMTAENVSTLNLWNNSCSAYYLLQDVPELLWVQWWSSPLWPIVSVNSPFFFPAIYLKILNNSHLKSCSNENFPGEQRPRHFSKEMFSILFLPKTKMETETWLWSSPSVVWGLLGAAMSKGEDAVHWKAGN